MFTGIHLQNYKSYKNLNLDLTKHGNPKKIIAIYGENGSGKSNLISVFVNLRKSINTLIQQRQITEFQKQLANTTNKDIDNHNKMNNTLLNMLNFKRVSDVNLSSIFNNSYLLNSDSPMIIKYDFKVNGRSGYYQLEFLENDNGDLTLKRESLYYTVRKSSSMLFDIKLLNNENENIKISPSLFSESMKKLVINDVERFWGKHTFLSIVNQINFDSNENYVKKNVLNNFLIVLADFNCISYRDDNGKGMREFSLLLRDYKGSIKNNKVNLNIMEVSENILNQYFVPLYSDIRRVFYKKTTNSDGKIDYELFEDKRIGGKYIEIPFSMESHGTQKLFELFPLFLNSVYGGTVIIDEIDQGIHDLLMDRIISNISDDIDGQLIFTTHDTQLMQELESDQVYIIQTDSMGNKRVISINKAKKINSNNSVQRLYLNGYFAGIPYSSDVDFYDIVNNLRGNNDE